MHAHTSLGRHRLAPPLAHSSRKPGANLMHRHQIKANLWLLACNCLCFRPVPLSGLLLSHAWAPSDSDSGGFAWDACTCLWLTCGQANTFHSCFGAALLTALWRCHEHPSHESLTHSTSHSLQACLCHVRPTTVMSRTLPALPATATPLPQHKYRSTHSTPHTSSLTSAVYVCFRRRSKRAARAQHTHSTRTAHEARSCLNRDQMSGGVSRAARRVLCPGWAAHNASRQGPPGTINVVDLPEHPATAAARQRRTLSWVSLMSGDWHSARRNSHTPLCRRRAFVFRGCTLKCVARESHRLGGVCPD